MNLTNLLLISGTGRNVGKTTLVCAIIKKFSAKHKIIALKITPHFHNVNPGLIIEKNEKFIISEEINIEYDKDTALMLKAGASKVYFIQVIDIYLKEAVKFIFEYIDTTALIICESARLRTLITPGIFILLNSKQNVEKNKDLFNFADEIAYKEDIHFIIEKISIKSGNWHITKS